MPLCRTRPTQLCMAALDLTVPQKGQAFSWIRNLYQPGALFPPPPALCWSVAYLPLRCQLSHHILELQSRLDACFRCPYLTTCNWIAITYSLNLPCELGASKGHWRCVSFTSVLFTGLGTEWHLVNVCCKMEGKARRGQKEKYLKKNKKNHYLLSLDP